MICCREVQFVVVSNIASMSIRRKGLFEPYLKSFYVRSNDAQQVKLLKVKSVVCRKNTIALLGLDIG